MPRTKAAFTYEALADELGDVKAQMAKLIEREFVLKTLLSSSGRDLVRGNRYQAAITHGERCTLDTEKVREFLTKDQLVQCERHTPYTSVRCSALTRRTK